MSFAAWMSVGVTLATLVALATSLAAPELVLMSAVTLLLLGGVLTPVDLGVTFGSPAVLSIAALLVVARGVRQTGILGVAADRLFGQRPAREPLLRLTMPIGVLSAFVSNTPIVAIFVPTVLDWCKRTGVAPSRMLIPLSYAAMLGGMTTLIGTSATLVVDGLMRAHGLDGLGMFEIGLVGLPAALGGVLLIALLAPRLLPERRDPVSAIGNELREYLVEMLVEARSPLVGRSIAEAGLRHLPGLFLINIERRGRFVGPVGPDECLEADDRLVFTGVASTVVDLRRFSGLVPAAEAHYDPTAPGRRTRLYEAVVSATSPLVGRTIRAARFRRRYDAAVIAVHRASRRLPRKLGAVVVRPGDTLMLESGEEFGARYADHADFALVSRLETEVPQRSRRGVLALIIVATMVLLVATRALPLTVGALAATGAMLATGILAPAEARRALDLSLLLVIGGALALGRSLEQSGVAAALSEFLGSTAVGLGPVGLLALSFGATWLLTELVTNAAAAALLFPLLVDLAERSGFDPRPIAIAIAVAASASFGTPFGYQTNLMVYGPGG